MDRGVGHFSLERVGYSVKIRTESAAQETPLINRARYFFFFLLRPRSSRATPLPTIAPPLAPSRVSRFLPRPCFRSAFPRSPPLHSRSPYPFLWKFPAENILPPPLPRDEIRGTLKFLYFRSIFGRYVLYPKNIYSSQDLFGEIKKQKTFINFNEYRDIDFLTFFLKPCFFYF